MEFEKELEYLWHLGYIKIKVGVAVYLYSPSIWETEAGGL
jgi:hypothetical protein